MFCLPCRFEDESLTCAQFDWRKSRNSRLVDKTQVIFLSIRILLNVMWYASPCHYTQNLTFGLPLHNIIMHCLCLKMIDCTDSNFKTVTTYIHKLCVPLTERFCYSLFQNSWSHIFEDISLHIRSRTTIFCMSF